MRIAPATLLIGLCAAVAACSDPGPAPSTKGTPDSAEQAAKTSLEVSLTACGDGQSVIATALQGSDLGSAQEAVRSTVDSCRTAAREVRQSALPRKRQSAAAIDEMTDGLAQVGKALPLADSAPKRARAIAQHGMRLYMAGLAKMKAANAA